MAPRHETTRAFQQQRSIIGADSYGEKRLLTEILRSKRGGGVEGRLDLRSDLVKVQSRRRPSSNRRTCRQRRTITGIISVGWTRCLVIRTGMWWSVAQVGAEVMTTGERGTISIVTDGSDLRSERLCVNESFHKKSGSAGV